MKDFAVALEGGLNKFHDFFLPVFVGVVDVPLITVGYHTLVTCAGDYLSAGFVVSKGQVFVDHLFFDLVFGFHNFLAFAAADHNHSFMESFSVTFVFGLVKFCTFVLRFDFHSFADNFGHEVAISFDFHDGNRFFIHHFLSDSIFFP